MVWAIDPYVGLGRIKFEYGPDKIRSILGTPDRDKMTPSGRRRLQYGLHQPAIVFQNDSIVEIAATPEIEGGIVYKDIMIFTEKPEKVLRKLQNENGQIFEANGFLVFFILGFTITGIHDDDLNQRSLVMFRKDFYWNDLQSSLKKVYF